MLSILMFEGFTRSFVERAATALRRNLASSLADLALRELRRAGDYAPSADRERALADEVAELLRPPGNNVGRFLALLLQLHPRLDRSAPIALLAPLLLANAAWLQRGLTGTLLDRVETFAADIAFIHVDECPPELDPVLKDGALLMLRGIIAQLCRARDNIAGLGHAPLCVCTFSRALSLQALFEAARPFVQVSVRIGRRLFVAWLGGKEAAADVGLLAGSVKAATDLLNFAAQQGLYVDEDLRTALRDFNDFI
jgi:hypothetical protein